jgi:hypothetical protein
VAIACARARARVEPHTWEKGSPVKTWRRDSG